MATLHEADADGDNQVSLEEFRTYIRNNNLGFHDSQIDAMFKAADKDNSGHLDTHELAYIFQLSDHSKNTKIQLVIPSTDSVSEVISPAKFFDRVSQFQVLFCQLFGGCTTSPTLEGCYLATTGQVVKEMVATVETYCSDAAWAEKQEEIKSLIRQKCKEWGQECMALIINGNMIYVNADIAEETNPEILLQQLASRVLMVKRSQ